MHACCCRFCGASLRATMVDLGMSPLANAYLTAEQLHQMEPFYPLRVYVCERCWLVQLEAFTAPESIFSDYAYFSSYSDSWLQHAKVYVEMAVQRFRLNATSQVVEIASNDGYLLKNFVFEGIPVLGVEPAVNVAREAEEKGVRTICQFFGAGVARELLNQGHSADLIIANNSNSNCLFVDFEDALNGNFDRFPNNPFLQFRIYDRGYAYAECKEKNLNSNVRSDAYNEGGKINLFGWRRFDELVNLLPALQDRPDLTWDGVIGELSFKQRYKHPEVRLEPAQADL